METGVLWQLTCHKPANLRKQSEVAAMENVTVKQEVEKISLSAYETYFKKFPVELFTSVMGVGGLAVAYQQFGSVFNAPALNLVILAVAYAFFGAVGLSYGWKLLRYRSEAAIEFNHPVKANFFSGISMSLLVLGVATFSFHRSLAFGLWAVGSVLHLLLVLTITSRWITRDYTIDQLNPAWFLPTAANLIVPILGVEFLPKDICWFFFSIGIFLWLTLSTILIYRITFQPKSVTPLLFVMMAPPSLAFVAYQKLSGTFDVFAHILLGTSFFFLLLLVIFMAPNFLKVRFSLACWGYTFPLCITTTSVFVAYKLSGEAGYAWIATMLLALTSLVVLVVTTKTFQAAIRKTLF